MKTIRLVVVLLAVFGICGCKTFERGMHELKPHRLWRWNYHDPPGRADMAF